MIITEGLVVAATRIIKKLKTLSPTCTIVQIYLQWNSYQYFDRHTNETFQWSQTSFLVQVTCSTCQPRMARYGKLSSLRG